jgi:hypothetical protein
MTGPISTTDPRQSRAFGRAWVAMAIVIALHVTDEAATGFLDFYNPAARAVRARLPFLPLPTFTFGVWLAGLALGVAVLLVLSPRAFRGSRWIARVALPLSVLMLANGLGHIGASFYLGRLAPGVYSAPLLLVASVWLFREAWKLLHG